MTTQLRRRIVVVLSQARESPVYWWRSRIRSITSTEHATHPIIYEPGELAMEDEQVKLLRLLYFNASPEEKKQFIGYLSEFASQNTIPLVTYMLMDLKAFDDLRSYVAARKPREMMAVLEMAARRLEAESFLYSDDDVHECADALFEGHAMEELDHDRAKRIFDIVKRIGYERLKNELLQGGNPEINVDQEKVLDRAAKLGFSKQMQSALTEIDRRIAAAATSFDLKACMDLIRTALEEFVEESAKTIEPKGKKPLATGPGTTHFGTPLDYLRTNGIISDDEHYAINGCYKLLSCSRTRVPTSWVQRSNSLVYPGTKSSSGYS
jgi:hypothetical protein